MIFNSKLKNDNRWVVIAVLSSLNFICYFSRYISYRYWKMFAGISLRNSKNGPEHDRCPILNIFRHRTTTIVLCSNDINECTMYQHKWCTLSVQYSYMTNIQTTRVILVLFVNRKNTKIVNKIIQIYTNAISEN